MYTLHFGHLGVDGDAKLSREFIGFEIHISDGVHYFLLADIGRCRSQFDHLGFVKVAQFFTVFLSFSYSTKL